MKIIVTCEHGGNQIPKEYASYFRFAKQRLQSHEGWDIGAIYLAEKFAKKFADFYFFTKTSRLLVEVNRSLTHPQLFSNITKELPAEMKKQILTKYYLPYRYQVVKAVTEWVGKKQKVLHLSVHSFTPTLNEEERNADVGLLYDSLRMEEKVFCTTWKKNISQEKKFKTRLNYPYRGRADGLIASLRKQFTSDYYLGFELEVNQKCLQSERALPLTAGLLQAFESTLASFY